MTEIDGPSPRVDFLRAFGGENCAVPVLTGSLWVQTVPDEHALVTLDVTESAHPREIARLVFDSPFRSRWLALDEGVPAHGSVFRGRSLGWTEGQRFREWWPTGRRCP